MGDPIEFVRTCFSGVVPCLNSSELPAIFMCPLSYAGANFLRSWHDEVDRSPCHHLFASVWPVKGVICKALDHLPVPVSGRCWDPVLELWLTEFRTVLLQVSFSVPSLVPWLPGLGRHFWVAVLPYFCSTCRPVCYLVSGDADSLSRGDWSMWFW